MLCPVSLDLVAGRGLLFGLLACVLFVDMSTAQPSAAKVASSDAVDRFGDALPRGVVRRFGSLRFRHASGFESISELTFSPDGKRIASVGPDHTVRLWDLDGRERLRLAGNKDDRFTSVSFSPDGSRLAARGDREMFVWDLDSGARLMHILGGSGCSPVFSADGKRIAATQLMFTPMAGYVDRSFRVWEIESGKLLHSLDSSENLLWPLTVALDRGLTASLDEKSIRIGRLDTGETVCTYDRHSANAEDVTFNRAGTMVASSCLHNGQLEIHLWNPVTGETKISHTAPTKFSAYKLTFSPDGRTLLGAASVRDFDDGYADGKIAVDSPARIEWIDVMTAQPRHHIDGVAAPAFSPDNSMIAAARFDRIELLDARTGETLERYPGHNAPVQKVAFSNDGKRVASVGRDHTIRYWDAATGDPLAKRDVDAGVSDASFSADLSRVAVLHGVLERNQRRRITVWDEAGEKPLFDQAMPDGDRLVAISADGSALATWGKNDLRVWDLVDGAGPIKITPPGYPLVISGFALSDDGDRVMAAEMGEPIRIWDSRTGELTLELEPDAQRLSGTFGGPFALSPDGRTLATHWSGAVVLYELKTGARIAKLPRQTTGYIAELAFSPDGKLLAVSARDGSIRLLAIATGKVLADFQTHQAGWTSIAFSPEGNQLLSGGGGAVLELRDIASFRRAVDDGPTEQEPTGDVP
ncbi:MAG: WD40 repeat domain-containing protein [Pirellulales bacterium]|nr:WD40 repeat domain-containing protein [Pirellulales bacterium]